MNFFYKIRFYKIVFLFLFYSIFSFQEKVKLIPENEKELVLKILLFGYRRSIATIEFWKNLNKFLVEYKESSSQIISRIRNPSINLNKELKIISIDLNSLIKITKEAYDSYAKILNESYENNILSQPSKNYIDQARNFPKSSFDLILNSLNYLSKIVKNTFIVDKIFQLKKILTYRFSPISTYVKIDQTLCKIHEENCDFQINLYQNYENFWLIEEERAKKFKEAYDILIKDMENK